MHHQSFISKAGKLQQLIGSDQDDYISIHCSDNNLCTFTVNEETIELSADKINIADFQIHAKAGNDRIDIIVLEQMIFPGIRVYPSSGINEVYSTLTKPYSRAVLNLDDGYNLLIYPENGSNTYINGFRSSPHNKIKIITTDPSEAAIFCEQDTDDFNSNRLFFKKNAATEAKELAVIYNTFTPEEYKQYAELTLLQLEGESIPTYLEKWLYVLDGPIDLIKALEINDAIIFSEG